MLEESTMKKDNDSTVNNLKNTLTKLEIELLSKGSQILELFLEHFVNKAPFPVCGPHQNASTSYVLRVRVTSTEHFAETPQRGWSYVVSLHVS